MLRTKFLALLIALSSVPGLLIIPAASAAPIDCNVNIATGTCVVSVVAPGSGGAPAQGGSRGGSGSGGPAVCTRGGKEISCTNPAGGYWHGSEDCYAVPVTDGDFVSGVDGQQTMMCIDENGNTTQRAFLVPVGSVPPPPPDPKVLAQRAIDQMGLRAIKVGMAPPPGVGKIGVIGLPTWMWVADPGASTTGPQTTSASERGFTVTATATLNDVTWSMGDGTSVVCHGAGTPYSKDQGARPSPDCGHTYTKSGDYTVTATSHWNVTWVGIGQSGIIPLTFSTSTQVTQAELQAIGQS